VLDQARAALAGPQRVLVIADRHALGRGEPLRGLVASAVAGPLVGLAAVSPVDLLVAKSREAVVIGSVCHLVPPLRVLSWVSAALPSGLAAAGLTCLFSWD